MIIPDDVWEKLTLTAAAMRRHEARMIGNLADFARLYPDLDMHALAEITTDMNDAAEKHHAIIDIITEENAPKKGLAV